MLIGKNVLRCFWKVVRGSEFQRIGASTQKEHKPNWRSVGET